MRRGEQIGGIQGSRRELARFASEFEIPARCDLIGIPPLPAKMRLNRRPTASCQGPPTRSSKMRPKSGNLISSSAAHKASRRVHDKMYTRSLSLAPAAVGSEDAQDHAKGHFPISFEFMSFPSNLASSIFNPRSIPYSDRGVSRICDCCGST
jgi:hypothetical protein